MTPPQNRLAHSIHIRFLIFLDPPQCNVKHFHVREKFWGYGSYPGRPPSKRTYFGRSACPNPANSLSTAPIPDFFGAAEMQRDTFSRARKKIGSYLVAGNPFPASWTFSHSRPFGLGWREVNGAECGSVFCGLCWEGSMACGGTCMRQRRGGEGMVEE